MPGEAIFAIIVMTGVGFGCGALFFGIGVWAAKNKMPAHFWSGSTVDPKTVTDIPAYNRANAKMWKQYSIPYWLSGIASLLSIADHRFSYVSVGMIILATVGIGWLIWRYNQICKEFITC